MNIDIKQVRTDGDTQSRLGINDGVVSEYSEAIEANKAWPLGPIHVFFDGSAYWLADGFHRVLAATRLNRQSIPCEVHRGTKRDAKIFAMTANDRHGLRMSREDKRACVEWLLANEPTWTQEAIAKTAGVTARTVKTIAAEHRVTKTSSMSAKGKTSPCHNVLCEKSEDESNATKQGKSSTSGNAHEKNLNATSRNKTATEIDEEPFIVDEETEVVEPVEPEVFDEPEPPTDKCPACRAKNWKWDGVSFQCRKCDHVYGEPVGDPEDPKGKAKDQIANAKKMAVSYAEYLMRAIDSYHQVNPNDRSHREAMAAAQKAWHAIKGW